MKLRNKKTGEIDEFLFEVIKDCIDLYRRVGHSETKNIWHYNSLAELNEEWEDYKEPKGSALDLMILTLTNFIENEPDEDKVDLEDCEQMLEKLKAWKRLKDKGFRFNGKTYETDKRFGSIFYEVDKDTYSEHIIHELELLFGGEE